MYIGSAMEIISGVVLDLELLEPGAVRRAEEVVNDRQEI